MLFICALFVIAGLNKRGKVGISEDSTGVSVSTSAMNCLE